MLHLPDDVDAIDDLAKHDVFAVEERRGHRGDEELGPVGAGAGVLRHSASQTDACARKIKRTSDIKTKQARISHGDVLFKTYLGTKGKGQVYVQPWTRGQAGHGAA